MRRARVPDVLQREGHVQCGDGHMLVRGWLAWRGVRPAAIVPARLLWAWQLRTWHVCVRLGGLWRGMRATDLRWWLLGARVVQRHVFRLHVRTRVERPRLRPALVRRR